MTFGQSEAASKVIILPYKVGNKTARRRPAFVGREPELRQLHEAFEAAASGDGSLIMLAGEPGIGKTALCEQLASFVSTRNGLALLGHCYPEGSAGVPYQPFVEALEGYARQQAADTFQAELGASAGEVARMVPAIKNLLQVEVSAPDNSEADRQRLLGGVLDCLRNIGASHPVLLLLEDLGRKSSGDTCRRWKSVSGW
jgi:predicted ATPase